MSYTYNDHVLLAYLLHKIYKDVTFGKAKRSFNSSSAPVIGQLKKANESASYQEISRSKNNATSNGFVKWERESARKGLDATSGAQFTNLWVSNSLIIHKENTKEINV